MKLSELLITVAAIGAIGATIGYKINNTPSDTIPRNERPQAVERPAEEHRASITDRLFAARTILVDERMLSWGKEYEIKVAGETLATVEGKNWKTWTDLFTLTTIDGVVLASERENMRAFGPNRSAAFFDGDGRPSGYFSEDTLSDFLRWGHRIHIYATDGHEIGVSKRTPGFGGYTQTITDAAGVTQYVIEKKFALGHEFELVVSNPQSAIPLPQAILLTCVEDAITDAEAKKDDD